MVFILSRLSQNENNNIIRLKQTQILFEKVWLSLNSVDYPKMQIIILFKKTKHLCSVITTVYIVVKVVCMVDLAVG